VQRTRSPSAPEADEAAERPLVARARQLLRAHAETAELIQLGAYRRGSDPLIDAAIVAQPALEAVLAQAIEERSALGDDFRRLAAALDGPAEAG
jgi:flagellum-specific ATP synthase